MKNGIEEPHYHLEIGEGEYAMHTPAGFVTRYCDYESLDDGKPSRKVPDGGEFSSGSRGGPQEKSLKP